MTKLSPGVTVPLEWDSASTSSVRKPTASTLPLGRFVPLLFSDIYDAYQQGGDANALRVAVGSSLGLGMNTMTDAQLRKMENASGIGRCRADSWSENMTPQQTIDAARIAHIAPSDLGHRRDAGCAVDPPSRDQARRHHAHHGLDSPVSGQPDAQAVHMLTVAKPGKSALIALEPRGTSWRLAYLD